MYKEKTEGNLEGNKKKELKKERKKRNTTRKLVQTKVLRQCEKHDFLQKYSHVRICLSVICKMFPREDHVTEGIIFSLKGRNFTPKTIQFYIRLHKAQETRGCYEDTLQ
jgi:hypothetical protein